MNRIEKQRRGGVVLRAAEENADRVIEGRAIVFNTPTLIYTDENGVEYYERIAPEALENTDMTDTCLRYNHRDSVPILARVRGGSLQIFKNAEGVDFRAALFHTSAAEDCYELVRQGALQCSFGFILPPEGGYHYDRATHTRTITRIDRLIDLSLVDFPAYKDTFVSARGLFELESEEEARLESLKRRRILLARTF